MGATISKSPAGFGAAIFGAPHGTAYRAIDNRVHAGAADAFRQALAADSEWLDHFDFDLGHPLLAKSLKLADLGNLPTKPKTAAANRALIEDTTRLILDAGAVPIMFGGDDSTPIPFIQGFAGSPPIAILQIDAHIDWRHERYGETQGFSSTMRRASEQPHVWRIVQAGARGLGSARPEEVNEAHAWGARIVPARDIHHSGIEAVLAHVPEDCDCLISLDCDALDVAQMPAVAYPSPGGLTFTQVAGLIEGVARKARIAGFAMVEFVPKRDPAGTAAFTAARLACNVIGRLQPPL
ncbi:MAG: arginase family protein [Rhizobiales bacterium]|nr:arginase family protein [Hyphomicrobiales bacterium]MBI3671846.1 arginase family protein [Hyphomicrobiales bacterium]